MISDLEIICKVLHKHGMSLIAADILLEVKRRDDKEVELHNSIMDSISDTYGSNE